MRSLLPLALIAALAACAGESAPGDATTAPQAAPGPAPPVASTPAAVPANPADGSDRQASFAGYGDLRFGTAAADMAQAWGGELKEVGKEANPACYFLTPAWVKTPAEFNFMVSEGRFARVATESDRYAAPGGGKVGMDVAELQRLYNGALRSSPHKYVEGGRYLSIDASGVAPTRLVFEANAAGIVSEWRLGLLPEADYVEGCA